MLRVLTNCYVELLTLLMTLCTLLPLYQTKTQCSD